MQLDQNRIAIRERSYGEILDLTLHVLRAYAAPLAAAFLVGVVPAMLLNGWLTAGAVDTDAEGEFPAGYLFGMGLLVLWEMPLVTAPITLYLGQSLFAERAPARKVAAGLAASLPQLLFYQVLLRGLLLPWVITWFLPFVTWPYLNEVILLERNPLRRGRRQQMTTGRRMMALHAGASGELFGQWLLAIMVGVLLVASVWLSLWCLAGVLVNEWQWQGMVYTLYYPLALWIVVGFFAVVRFLGYLDLRIRREGWEVELMMRAEGARLERQLV